MQQTNQRINPLFSKLVIMAIIIGISFVATLFVFAVVEDRSNRADIAKTEIATSWSNAQTITGPVITIPVRVPVTTNTRERTTRDELVYLLPDTLLYDITLDTEVRSRGIFDAVVYTSTIEGSGTFDLNSVEVPDTGIVGWDEAAVTVGIADTRSVNAEVELTWNDDVYSFEPGLTAPVLGASGMNAPVTLNRTLSEQTFSFRMTLRGSEAVSIIPVGRTTTVAADTDWPSPSFTGAFLPTSHELSEGGFTANWSVSSFGRSLPQSWNSTQFSMSDTVARNLNGSAFGVTLYQDVDFYTQVNRSIKYSILFITLTFLAFFMFEVLAGLRIHPMNYLLVGLAIALFYLLLLSFSENIGFLSAYIVATLTTVGLVTGYSKSVLKAQKRANTIAALLFTLYGYLYVLLQLDELSLIFGSIFLFVILTIVMYLTRNIDWYAFSERK